MIERPTRDDMLLSIAWTVSHRSTCDRLRVGAVLSRDGRVLSTGYNGAPSGMPHCNHECDCGTWAPLFDQHTPVCATQQICLNTVHAEANAIVFAARHGVSTQDSSMFVTHSPCMVCARLIINAGIVAVVWSTPYRDTTPLDMLSEAGVKVTTL